MKNVTYINAGAGSGKTYRLTETLTNLIKSEKVKPEQVILTTFTTKAANEFKEKAKAFLYDEGLYDAAMQLDHAMIGTVHSVCQRMIDKYWFNLGLSPNMGVMAEEDTAYYISQSLSELPTDEELKVLHGFARYFDIRVKDGYIVKKAVNYDFWQDHLKAVIGFATNYELEDFKQSEEESLNFIRKFVKADTNCSFTFDELKAVIAEHETFLRSRKQSDANDKRIKALEQAQRHLNSPSLGVLRNIDSTIGSPKGYGMLAENFHNRMAGIWTSQMVYDKQEKYIRLIFDLAQRWKENFAQFKRDKNLLDYNDMEKYMRLLMMNEDIASEISQSYRYLFVDEFQDSSPIQVKIFDALSDLMEHSYWVGDYKQAIYGFRGSDIALTKAVVDRVSKKESGCDTDTLDTSWRSLPDIVELNNDVFRKTFADVLEEKNICLKQHRKNENHEESLLYFVSSDEYGIAEHVLKLLNQGIKPNEIAVLARANATLAEVASQLKQYKIPSSREDSPIIDSFAYSLTSSLLRIVGSTRDSLAKATVAILTEEDYNTRTIIEEKILNDACDNAKTEDYLAQVPLIRRLMTIRPKLQQ
ncbi:UvrD-helicase domain-containing protein [Bacteroides caecicola]|uniref:UvrD-helicase domain-containing protein n=1 Tax=Bacteroides caecicola TaxID=1462569 RepID=A0ABS2FA20_9BACE|nr:UvrD-helicase domain-containing protein [Bacteroides caecicola]MBM6806618.1 UvrD-helicase domain-containing protein [Bacteroides caecicola]